MKPVSCMLIKSPLSSGPAFSRTAETMGRDASRDEQLDSTMDRLFSPLSVSKLDCRPVPYSAGWIMTYWALGICLKSWVLHSRRQGNFSDHVGIFPAIPEFLGQFSHFPGGIFHTMSEYFPIPILYPRKNPRRDPGLSHAKKRCEWL